MKRSSIKVLLIEDNPGDARLLQELLREVRWEQFELIHADQLATGLQCLEEGLFDVLLLDLALPDSRGLETLTKMQRQAPDIPIVLLTGLDDETFALEAVREGAQDYLVKGEVDSNLLARTMRYAIERKRGQQELHQRNRELALLNQIIAASTEGQGPEAVLETACRELARTFNLPRAVAALVNEEKSAAVIVAEYRADGATAALNRVISLDEVSLFKQLLKHKSPLVVDSDEQEPARQPLYELMAQGSLLALLNLPLVINGEIAGTLALGAIEPRHFSEDEVSLAWRVANQIAGTLARTRLDKERRLLSMAIEQTAESIVITDVSGTILYVNPAFERITGYGRTEAIGQTPRILKSGKQNQEFYRRLWETIQAGQVWQGRLVNRRKDGSFYTDDATITPVRDERGTVVNYVSAQRDVTHELELEEQYRQAQKMEAIGRLTGGVAHDFNNLLTVINGFSELMYEQLSADDPLRETIDKVLGAGQRATDLVRQLLAFSRKQIIEPRVLELNKVVANIDKMLQRIIGEDIKLKTRLAPELGLVKIDATQMGQIIVNLAVNARDAMPDGGQLMIETANVNLDETYATDHLQVAPGQYVLLAISDTGLGMSTEVKKHIFEPFFTTKEPGKGTGLGLATVFGIVKQHRGVIWCYSEEGQGTSFKIYLPRVVGTEQSIRPLSDKSSMPRGSETILLVEDDTEVRNLTRKILQKQGYTLLEAQDGREALLQARRYADSIHLLLTDVVMPNMKGTEVVVQLQQLQPDVKVLFMSGYTDETIVHHGILEPGVAFLHKPFTPMALTQKVRQVLDGESQTGNESKS